MILPKARPHGCQSNHKQKPNQENEKESGDDVNYQGDGGVGEDVVAHGSQASQTEHCIFISAVFTLSTSHKFTNSGPLVH